MPKIRPSYADSVTAASWSPWSKAWGGEKSLLPSMPALLPRGRHIHIKPTCWEVVVSPPTLLAPGTSSRQSLSQHNLNRVWLSFFPCIIAGQFSDSANIYGGVETNNEFLGEIGAELLTSVGDGEASISMNSNRMDESDVSASVASPADYIPFFSHPLDHLVLTSIDANAAIITAHLPPATPSAESI